MAKRWQGKPAGQPLSREIMSPGRRRCYAKRKATVCMTIYGVRQRGEKIKLSTCEKRLRARPDAKASGVVYGENGEKWMILDGH